MRRENHVKIQGEDDHLQAKEENLEEKDQKEPTITIP